MLARTLLALSIVLAAVAAPEAAFGEIRALIIDGQNNHKAWPETTPLMKRYLEQTGLFQVDVATTPPKGGDFSSFHPDFSQYDVVVSNYSDVFGGDPWPDAVNAAFEKFVREGGGFVSVHAADNAFPKWAEYNEMIAVGGWNGRDEHSGPLLRLREDKWAKINEPGKAGHHGKRHEFKIDIRVPNHPITEGLPAHWLHTEDELYDSLRGPAENVAVLASAYSDPATGGTGENEPILMAISYHNGRVFHTTLGHNEIAIEDVGFIVTLQRGAEWAATGKVTQKVPKDFPSADHVSVRR